MVFILQIIVASALRSKRSNWGQNEQWEGNYLSKNEENSSNHLFNAAVNNIRNNDRFQTILFSAFVKKYNRFNKQNDRVILLTEQVIYKLDRIKFKNLKKWISINEISGLSISPGQDQLITIHSKLGNDIIISLETKGHDRIGELVGIIMNRYQQ